MSELRAEVRVHRRIEEIGREDWNACAGRDEYGANPFISYEFLHALEQSGCVGMEPGWAVQHLSVHDTEGRVAGVMPLYLKSHSQGEYVFDHAWAQAYQRAGGRYYPKLQCAAPFTPATGPRMMARPDADLEKVEDHLLGGALTLCDEIGASSLHITFPQEGQWRRLGEAGLLLRQDRQFHWHNAGYQTFDDFLAALSSGRRKTIRRERREAQKGLQIEAVAGGDLTEAHWDAFYGFYMDTGARKWGRPYLNRRFFSLLGEAMADRVLLMMAKRDGRYIAGALNLIGGEALYGRNWGCIEDVPFLHFELCYYQAIEHAIRLGLGRVEAGAQGEHKLARGYLPVPVYSAHFIADRALREPVARYLDQERLAVDEEIEGLTDAYSPFRHED